MLHVPLVVIMVLLTPAVLQATESVAIETVVAGTVGGRPEKSLHFELIRTEKKWVQFHTELFAHQSPAPKKPAVDFKKYLLLYAGLGQKSSGGYAIGFEPKAELTKGELTLTLAIKEPTSGGMAIALVTTPFAVAKIPRADLHHIQIRLPGGTIIVEWPVTE